MNEDIGKKTLALAEPIVAASGLEIWGLEIQGSPAKTVRLFVEVPLIQRQGKEISANVDQCEEISRKLGLALDVEDCMPGSWTLEVSSPGLERKFFELSQMRPYVGDLLEVFLKSPLPAGAGSKPRSVWRGKLLEVGEDDFSLAPCQIAGDGEILPEKTPPCRISFDQCKQARRLHVFLAPQKPGKGRSRSAS